MSDMSDDVNMSTIYAIGEVERAVYRRIAVLVLDGAVDEACKLADLMKKLGIV